LRAVARRRGAGERGDAVSPVTLRLTYVLEVYCSYPLFHVYRGGAIDVK
jgi:hypothetical protein